MERHRRFYWPGAIKLPAGKACTRCCMCPASSTLFTRTKQLHSIFVFKFIDQGKPKHRWIAGAAFDHPAFRAYPDMFYH